MHAEWRRGSCRASRCDVLPLDGPTSMRWTRHAGARWKRAPRTIVPNLLSIGRRRGWLRSPVTGTLVLYAQRARQALDGTGEGADSPLAAAFAARLPECGVDIRLLVSQVRDDVLATTGGKQEPFFYGSL
jgi:hypothetical protein